MICYPEYMYYVNMIMLYRPTEQPSMIIAIFTNTILCNAIAYLWLYCFRVINCCFAVCFIVFTLLQTFKRLASFYF